MLKKEKKFGIRYGKECASCGGAFAPYNCGGAGSYNSNFKVEDPVQGPIEDCFLIAALASIAWVKPSKLNLYPNYSFLGNFENPDVDLTKDHDNMNVLLDAQGYPAGAKLGINNNNWPLLYEKAYAIAQGCGNWGRTKCPDVSGIRGGVGLTALKEVYRTNNPGIGNANSPFIININTDGTVAKMVEKLNRCTSTQSGKAQSPAVAWTDGSTKEIKNGHTYSYLGYYKDAKGSYYIILRNPCRSEPTTNVTTSGNWQSINFTNLNDGIFALKLTAVTTNLNIGYVW